MTKKGNKKQFFSNYTHIVTAKTYFSYLIVTSRSEMPVFHLKKVKELDSRPGNRIWTAWT